MNHEFSCCHAFLKCNYGKEECVFAETDPGKKTRCRCYKLKHGNALNGTMEVKKVKNVQSEQTQLIKNEEGQLSLF